MRCIALSVATIFFGSVLSNCPATELPSSDEIKAALAKPILEESTPQEEVKAFCEARVLRLPAPESAERKSPEAWQAYMAGVRQQVLEQVVYRGEAARWRDFTGRVEWLETVEGGEGYQLKKLRFEALPGLWVPAILYEPAKLDAKAPVFLNVNGHDGAGKAAPYKQIRCINLAKRGIIALNLEWYGMGQLRGPGFGHYKLNQLDLCGTSGVAPFFLAMKRGLDILLTQERADASRVGVAGLSGGGWQTIFFSALDPRVTLANPVAGYSSYLTRIHHYSDLGDSEQTPVDLAATGDYLHLTAMLAPRVALLTFNEKDNCCFAAPHALPPLLEAARPAYQLFGKAGHLHEHINYDPGTHNFERDNREALYKVIGEHWFAKDSGYSAMEIAGSEMEVRKADDLNVDLPGNNLDFQKLASQLMTKLPRGTATRASVRTALRLTKTDENRATATEIGQSTLATVRVLHRKLRVAGALTVPAVELNAGGDKGTAVLLADEGRAATAEQAHHLLAEGWSVLAVDPFYFGESKIKSHGFLFALLVSSVGERPLGVQANQLHEIARWLKNERKNKQVKVVAVGPRTSLIALAAAATDDVLDGVETSGSLGSLKEVIERGGQVDQTPEQFCFGLLETADIPDLVKLIAPREVRAAASGKR